MAIKNLPKTKTSQLAQSGFKSMFIAHVVLGKTYKPTKDEPNNRVAPQNCHSIEGDAGAGNLNYHEAAVFDECACRPAYLVIYKVV